MQFIFSADLIALLVDLNINNMAATKYASKNIPISAFTSNNGEFVRKLSDANPAGGASPVSDGMAYCEQQFKQIRNGINAILLYTDGRYNVGVGPLKNIDLVKNEYSHLEVFLVKVGNADDSFISGFSSVFEVYNFLDSGNVGIEIEDYLYKVCQP